MKNTISKQSETIKKGINDVSQKSKDSINPLIESSSKQFDSALETNKKMFDSISKTLYEKEMDPAIVSTFKSTFGNGLKLSKDMMDAIIDIYTKRIDFSINFTTKFMEIIENEDLNTPKGQDMLFELIKENFDKSSELSVNNMEKMVSLYNAHLNFALNFNKKFADIINFNSQIESMFKLQKKNLDTFNALDMVTEWWKDYSGEKVKV